MSPGLKLAQATLFLFSGLASGMAHADQSSDPANIKAALVFNLSKFVTYPESTFSAPDTRVRLCLLNENDDIGRAFLALQGKKAQGREVEVSVSEDVRAFEYCHVLFLSSSDESIFRAMAARLRARPTLTISDMNDFAINGGMVGLTTQDGRLHFTINVDAAKRAGLSFSAQVLNLATIVHDP